MERKNNIIQRRDNQRITGPLLFQHESGERQINLIRAIGQLSKPGMRESPAVQSYPILS